jgi:CPA2 family monovalent cation:H+ antiporter-2
VAVSAATTLTTPWLIRASPAAAAWVDHRLPGPLQTFVALYGSWIEAVRRPSQRGRVGRIVRLLVLDGALLAGIVIAAARLFPRGVALLEPRIGATGARTALFAAAVALTAPFVVGIVRLVGALAVALAANALPKSSTPGFDLAAAPRRALIVGLQLATAIALGLPLAAVTQPFLPGPWIAAALAALLALLALRLWRSAAELQGHVRAGAQVVAEALSAPRTAEEEVASELVPGLGSPVRHVVSAGSAAVGQTLASIDLRARTGATVLAIRRGADALIAPTGREVLRADDVLALAGTRDAVEAARALLC